MGNSAGKIPGRFQSWFLSRQWSLREHQATLLREAKKGNSALLVAPTGGGKTLGGFLPSLIELNEAPTDGLHTLYISPLKALATDIARNLEDPVREMALDISIETRTGDTPAHKRQRQREKPPNILLTTPEQLALLLAHPSADDFFADLRCVILDELHALVSSKRGDLLSLGLGRLWTLVPTLRTVGLSATVPDTTPLRGWLVPQEDGQARLASLVLGHGGAEPEISILSASERIPWQGHLARHAYKDVYEAIKTARTALIFTNTRSQAEIIFSHLWQLNEDNLPIALHHGSLDVGQRRKVEAAMIKGSLRAVVCTSTLNLGIDWGEVDLVIQIGAPKGSSRLIQRIGRSNHRYNEASRALLVPANRFEVLECQAACDAVRENALDGEPPRVGGLDVLAQHIWGTACAGPFAPDDLYREVRSSWAYRDLSREDFNQAVEFVATGGYALKAYDRFRRIVPAEDGRLKIRNAHSAQQYRMNVGTIIEAQSVTLRLGSIRKGKDGKPYSQVKRIGRKLGTVEEWFIDHLGPKDTFLFGGEVLRFEGMQDGEAFVTRADSSEASVPSWQGGKFPLTTYLAERVRRLINAPEEWRSLPDQVRDWLELQQIKSTIPSSDEILIETFPRQDKHFLVCYPFDGRLAHQSLGMLLTRRLERAGIQPIGFCPTEYALSIWSRKSMAELNMASLFDEDMLGDDLETWLADAALMKHTFRNCAVVAGLIERHHPGERKTGRQVTFSADLIYDVLREHEPDHLLLKAAWTDAAGGFLDIARLSGLLSRVQGRLNHMPLAAVSPMAVPIMMEINREAIHGSASEAMLEDLQREMLGEIGLVN